MIMFEKDGFGTKQDNLKPQPSSVISHSAIVIYDSTGSWRSRGHSMCLFIDKNSGVMFGNIKHISFKHIPHAI